MNTIYLDEKMVPAHLRRGYAGKKFKAEVCLSVTIPSSAGLWDGGSRDVYTVIRLDDGVEYRPAFQGTAPWNKRRDLEVKLEPGIAVVEHSIFCGKDMGLRFYVHPDNAAALLPPPAAELTSYEELVLVATSVLKSSYQGRDRYQMALGDYHCRKVLGNHSYPTREQWSDAKASLVGKGLLNKAGAITTAGRTATEGKANALQEC